MPHAPKMIPLDELEAYLDELLDSARFEDYAPNGIQVEGRPEVRRIVGGVTASLALLEAAAADRADAVLVHHGWFWRNEDPRVRGMKGRRMQALMNAGMSLIAYHLPLDAHPVLGNNARLAHALGIESAGALVRDGRSTLVFHGGLPAPVPADAFARRIAGALGREPLHVAGGPDMIRRVAWCTGAAQDYIDLASDAGVDAYISGEISERTTHVARESGLHYYAAGHHATERGGIQALGTHLADRFGVSFRFVDVANPA